MCGDKIKKLLCCKVLKYPLPIINLKTSNTTMDDFRLIGGFNNRDSMIAIAIITSICKFKFCELSGLDIRIVFLNKIPYLLKFFRFADPTTNLLTHRH